MTSSAACATYDALIRALSVKPRAEWSWHAALLLRIPRDTVIGMFDRLGPDAAGNLIDDALIEWDADDCDDFEDGHLVCDDGSLWG